MTLRRITSLNQTGLAPNDPGPAPRTIMLKLTQLRINEDYQRKLTSASIGLIRKIANDFQWSRYKLPSVVLIDGLTDELTQLPVYEVTDGQHTAIGAATNGHIKELPCMPALTASSSLQERAASFVQLNTNRLAMTPMAIYHASLIAGDPLSLVIDQACRDTGCTMLKVPPALGMYQVGDLVCVAALKALAKEGGYAWLRRLLALGVACDLAPISRDWLVAFKILLFGHSDLRLPGPDRDQAAKMIELAVRREGVNAIVLRARDQFNRTRMPIAQSLALFLNKTAKAMFIDQA